MQKRKGFTLVELVIVIAVIAILAGVLIGTFASVISKANESARMQEIKAQEHEQKADDLLKKIENSNWYGWEDFETSIVEKITANVENAIVKTENKAINVTLDSAAVQKAVSEAMTKYYAEHAMGNTTLTEEQVKAIIENALGSFKYEGVTKAQVETVVNSAVSKMATGLTAVQVQKIVNAAADRVEAGQLTAGQITTIVSNALATNNKDLVEAIALQDEELINAKIALVLNAINTKQCSTLTAKEVEDIVAAAVKGGGTTSWVSADTYEAQEKFTLETADDVKGLATLVNGGYAFEGKTIELKGTKQTIKVNDVDTEVENVIKLDGKNWTPIGNSYETQFEGKIVSADTTKPLVIDGLTLDEQFNAVINGILINCDTTGNMDKVGVGFVAYLGKGATLENVTFTNANINITDTKMDGISIGVAVGYLDGGTIKNVKVVDSSVKAVFRVGGLCGAAGYGTITECEVKNTKLESTGANGLLWDTEDEDPAKWRKPTEHPASNYHTVGGLIGYARQFEKAQVDAEHTTVNITKTSLTNVKLTSISGSNDKVKPCKAVYGFISGCTVNAGTLPKDTEVTNGTAYTGNTGDLS